MSHRTSTECAVRCSTRWKVGRSAYRVGSKPRAPWVVDLDQDGKNDVTIAYGSGWLLFRGKGDGTLEQAKELGSISATSLISADFNSDGYADMVVGGGGPVTLYLGDGELGVTAPIKQSTLSTVQVVSTADFNGDGALDVLGQEQNSLRVHLNCARPQ